MIKEPTSSVFVFREEAGTWLTALVWHPRLECWLPSGGHVASTENIAEAAIREAREETGLDVQLLSGPVVPVPAGYPHEVLCAPWWITDLPLRAEPVTSTTAREHFAAAMGTWTMLVGQPCPAQPTPVLTHELTRSQHGDKTDT